jgi:DNA-binding MarR family transcriptional regulator
MEPIKNVVLGDSALSLDQADLLIELYWAKTGVGELRPDEDGFVTFKQVENSLLNSQPHISRRMKEMAKKNWVAIRELKKGHRHHGNSHGVRLTESGFKIIEPIWLKFQKLSETLLRDVSSEDRRVHLFVNESIRHHLHPFRTGATVQIRDSQPVENLISILKARRELISPIKRGVLLDCALSLEIADILTTLYGTKDIVWPDPIADKEGYVTLGQLQASLVHSQTPSQILLSRRVRSLEQKEWIEIKRHNKNRKYLNRDDSIIISESGTKVIKPVWAKYQEFAQMLLAEIPSDDQGKHLSVSHTILQRLRPTWTSLI